MRTVDDFARIRQLHRDGLSARRIATQLGVGRDTVRKALQHPEPTPYTLAQPREAPVFGPFRAVVDAILAADATAPRKQRHTGTQVYRRLVAEHGYTGSYDPVRRHLKARRLAARETFVPLDHAPGHRCEADFGHIHVDFPDGRRLVPVLVVTWSYSNAPFAVALPTERTEAVLHGLVEAFAAFGCVPREVWWDNPRTVALHIHRGRDRTLHPRYAAPASHYAFAPPFCRPRTPREKPRVENRVKDLERMWTTPVPQVRDLAELNAHLRRCCQTARDRTCGGHPETVGTRFDRDRAAAGPLPAHAFDPCVLQPASVDKYQTARFDGNAYSVPRRWAFRPVTVRGYVDRVAVVADGREVASHPRGYGRGERVLDPLHFLVVLDAKPAALDHAPVYRDWHLPAALAALRRELEDRLGRRAGPRQYIRVLQLLARHPVERIERAVLAARVRGDPTAAAIAAAADRLAGDATGSPALLAAAHAVPAPRPDLSRFDRLLTRPPHGGPADERPERPTAEGQPEAVEAPHHAGRARQAGPGGDRPG